MPKEKKLAQFSIRAIQGSYSLRIQILMFLQYMFKEKGATFLIPKVPILKEVT